jgi:radical SAM protein with 4Fe4S-binding SPASM domain
MPVWNRAHLVGRAIESVLAQTYQGWELVIVDDGSDDGLAGVVAPYLSERVILRRISHRGPAAARNHGVLHSHHPIIAYLDSDNAWRPGYLARMRAALAGPPTAAAAYCRYQTFQRDRHGTIRPTGDLGRPFSFVTLLDEPYIDLNTFVHLRACLEHTGLHDEGIKRMEDWDFILRVATTYPPRYVPEVLADYYLRCYDDSVTCREEAKPVAKLIRGESRVHDGPVRVRHDAIEYTWRNVGDEKRHNWARMRRREFDTSTFSAWGYPYMLQVEPTNTCNLRCPLCPTGRGDLNRPPRHMKLAEFKGLIDDMERYLLFAILWDWGEPLLNRELPEMVRYAAERDIKTVTSTNGHFFRDEAYMAALLTSGLTTMIVAIDSISPESYDVYRKKGKLDEVRSGVERIVALKRKLGSGTRIVVRTVVMRQNERELASTRAYAKRIGADQFVVKTLNPACGTTSLDSELVPDNPRYRRLAYRKGTMERIPSEEPCTRVWKMSNILSNGDVAPCCYDFCGDMKVGNINESRFTEIWASPAYQALRRRVYTAKETIERCRQCVDRYQLSDSGMFVESRQFRRQPGERLVDATRSRIFSPQALRVARRAARRLGLSRP